MAKQPTGPAPRREEQPQDIARSAKVTAVREKIQTGQYVIDKDAVAENLVTMKLRPLH